MGEKSSAGSSLLAESAAEKSKDSSSSFSILILSSIVFSERYLSRDESLLIKRSSSKRWLREYLKSRNRVSSRERAYSVCSTVKEERTLAEKRSAGNPRIPSRFIPFCISSMFLKYSVSVNYKLFYRYSPVKDLANMLY